MDPNAFWTPGHLVMTLLNYETLPQPIWEPACGTGQIASLLSVWGFEVLATDHYDYGYQGQNATLDFFTCDPGVEIGSIVTNPPWLAIGRWVERCCQLKPRKIALLLPHNGLGDVYSRSLGQGTDLWPSRIIRLGRPWFTQAATGRPFRPRFDVFWFVLSRGHTGDAVVTDGTAWRPAPGLPSGSQPDGGGTPV